MTDKQRTLAAPISVSGTGLHTGVEVTLTFKPAPTNSGICFQRIDLDEKPVIPADCDHVIDTNRGTTIGLNGVTVATIEHVMAALKGMQIDNAMVEIDNDETPIIDRQSILRKLFKKLEPQSKMKTKQFLNLILF